MSSLIIALLCASLSVKTCVDCLYFEDGYDHHYTYFSESDTFGLHNFTTVMKFRIRQVNTTYGSALYLLAMDSFVQHTEQGFMANNPKNWNLDKEFYLYIDNDGLVKLVYHMHDEDDEVVMLKKVLASTLTAKVKVVYDDQTTFQSMETDHNGQLPFDYRIENTIDGFTIIRNHQSTTHVIRNHQKAMYINHVLTPTKIEAHDNISFHHSGELYENSDGMIYEPAGKAKFPKISTISRSQMILTAKRKHNNERTHNLTNLKEDNLIIKEKPKVRTSLHAITHEIEGNMSCIRTYTDEFDTKRIDCVHLLRQLVHSLRPEDFKIFGNTALSKRCSEGNAQCTKERDALIDIILSEGSVHSQMMALEHILLDPNVTEDDFSRCLIHCNLFKQPIQLLVKHMEHRCHGHGQTIEYFNTTLTYIREEACLSLGAMAKSIANQNQTEADRIVSRLESLLEHHNESHTHMYIEPKLRQSLADMDEEVYQFIDRKATLLHSLGNAGNSKSLSHIRSYMKPNIGPSSWRRAAIHALRHFKCLNSAEALLQSHIHEKEKIVRLLATNVLTDHPKGNDTIEKYMETTSTNVTLYPNQRIRREAKEGERKIKVPSADESWGKIYGTKEIGASVSTFSSINVDLDSDVQSSKYMIDIHTEAHTDFLLGLLGLKFTVLKSHICFKGHLEYDMNTLKDYNFSSQHNTASDFDEILSTIVDPLKTAVNDMRHTILTDNGEGLAIIVNDFIASLQHIPFVVDNSVERIEHVLQNVIALKGGTSLESFKDKLLSLRQYVDDIKTDILSFYQAIGDEVFITLPYVVQRITDGFNGINDGMKHLMTGPQDAISSMSRSLSIVKMAVVMMVDVKSSIEKRQEILKGRTLEWLQSSAVIGQLLTSINIGLDELQAVSPFNKTVDSEYNGDKIGHSEASIETHLSAQIANWKHILQPIEKLMFIAKPYMDGFKIFSDVTKEIKNRYIALRNAVDGGSSKVKLLFGPKFDIRFPNKVRKYDTECTYGQFPSTTDGYYNTTGIDLEVGNGIELVSPIDGIVDTFPSHIVIKPTEKELNKLELIIENLKPKFELNGKRVNHGTAIGTVLRSIRCQSNFIHLSLRERHKGDVKGWKYKYVDPSGYLDRSQVMPKPVWKQDCNDYAISKMGFVIKSGRLVKQNVQIPIPRKGNENNFNNEMRSYNGIPNTPINDNKDQVQWKNEQQNELNRKIDNLDHVFQTGLYNENGPQIPRINGIFDVKQRTIDEFLDSLRDDSPIKHDMIVRIANLTDALTKLPNGSPAAISVDRRYKLLQMHNSPTIINQTLIITSDELLTMYGKVCEQFKGAVAPGYGHVCIADTSCSWITCNAAVEVSSRTHYIRVSLSVVTQTQILLKIQDNLDSTEFHISKSDDDQRFTSGLQLENLNVSLLINVHQDGNRLIVDADIQLCNYEILTCLPNIVFLEMLYFSTNTRNKRGISSAPLYDLKADTHIFDLMNQHATSMANSFKQLIKKTVDDVMKKLLKFLYGFKFHIKLPKISINIGHEYRYIFMAGPVPLSVGFFNGIVIGLQLEATYRISPMKHKIIVTPSIGYKMSGDIALEFGFARGGFRLAGYICVLEFPLTLTTDHAKSPKTRKRLDNVIIPLRMELSIFADVGIIPGWSITVFNGVLFACQTKSFNAHVYDSENKYYFLSLPTISPARREHLFNTSRQNIKKREIQSKNACIVNQLAGRMPYDTAFNVELYAKDELSDVRLYFSIGTQPGGTNIMEWHQLGGNSFMMPTTLPGSVPLYWTTKASNSDYLEVYSQCSLKTFDNTLPHGRVDHSFKYSSHPSNLSAVVVVFEDSPLKPYHLKAVGLSQGKYGSEISDWHKMTIGTNTERAYDIGILRKFTIPKKGKLVAFVLKTSIVKSADKCAEVCIAFGQNCFSFDYEHHSETCDLHDVVHGTTADVRVSGTYSYYERLLNGYHSSLQYADLELLHGTVYYINTKITNVLGYESYLYGEGTMVDFTPPEPGIIKNAEKDVLTADKCNAAKRQQCIDITSNKNHRNIIDGDDSETVFNGHEAAEDMLFTLTNHYVSANWKGFHDDESGIWGYNWAVGSHVCGTDILDFNDPFSHLNDKKFWNYAGLHKNIHLADAQYFVTVEALNGVEYGGSLVTTVCHSIPFTVDTTAPMFNGVTDVIYDEDFDLIAIYYEANDDLSKIAKAEFGLGITKYDVGLRPYSLHKSMDRDDPFIALEDLGLKEGVPAWLRIRVTNNVHLFTSGHGEEPILIDKTPPTAGFVMDGDILQQDITYQSSTMRICAQWQDFFDEQSGLERFVWGVGTTPGLDDIAPFRNLTQYDKSSCTPATLHHNVTYFSTVIAYNNALNPKPCNSSSDGVLVDDTPPIAGRVQDGISVLDMEFSSESVLKSASWNGFEDPESSIDRYMVDIYVNDVQQKNTYVGKKTLFEDKTVSMNHRDKVNFIVHGFNGAGVEIQSKSNGFFVDQTSPYMNKLSDSYDGQSFQSNNKSLFLSWQFNDDESDIKEYRTSILKTEYGITEKVWPFSVFNKTVPMSKRPISTTIENIDLVDGVMYSLHVIALNGARLSSSRESKGITIDTTPPTKPEVFIGLPSEDEELDDDGNVLHNDPHGIRIHWSSFDSESYIDNVYVAIGTHENKEQFYKFSDFGTDNVLYIHNVNLQPSTESKLRYIVFVKTINRAGLYSEVGHSKPIYLQKENIPGIVFDGRSLYVDEQFTIDKTSLAASFYGFESDSCGISRYEWAIGTNAYLTDVLSFTSYGLVLRNRTYGQCQIHTELYDDTKYFVTVRAITNCKDEFIVSTSDGITVDSRAPTVIYYILDNLTATVERNQVIYQPFTDNINLGLNSSDSQIVKSVTTGIGSLPLETNIHGFSDEIDFFHSISIQHGSTIFLNTKLSDYASNANITSSSAIVGDLTAPVITGLQCTESISLLEYVVYCSFDRLVENESLIDKIHVSYAAKETNVSNSIIYEYNVPKHERRFSRDLFPYLSKYVGKVNVVYCKITVSNVVGHSTSYGRNVIVDWTVPTGSLIVVTGITSQRIETHQQCQQPTSFIEFRHLRLEDEESGINTDRFHVSIGTRPYGNDIQSYQSIVQKQHGSFFIGGLRLKDGTKFHVTLRVYNKAGLYADITSERVIVSQSPQLKVNDGHNFDDIDFQSRPNIVKGRWEYTDECPIKEVFWLIEENIDKAITDYQQIPYSGNNIYNDEISLETGKKYFLKVKTIDFLNRTKIARSDGFTVRIQPPFPGYVRDGLLDDVNYQHLTTELSANWDSFGNQKDDPTQTIDHYEIAIGNDRRYAMTRSNVHYFINVGLNRSYTVTKLNLTEKLIKYYMTVRAYSSAGSYSESTSNGVRVGFSDTVDSGYISVNKFQPSTTAMEFSWGGFYSDIAITQYKVGISSHSYIITNDTLACEEFMQNSSAFDVAFLVSVGVNEYIKLTNLNLTHGHLYYPTVLAENEAGMCTSITHDPVVVDTSPPSLGILKINGLTSDLILFATSATKLHTSWVNFTDTESGISHTIVSLLECSSCSNKESIPDDCKMYIEQLVEDETKASFYEVELNTVNTYVVNISVFNKAGLFTSLRSPPILIDTTSPLPGAVKITTNWEKVDSFQSSVSTIVGKLAIATTSDEYICKSQIIYFPKESVPIWTDLSNTFTGDYKVVNISGAYLGIGYNGDLTKIIKAGIKSNEFNLKGGNYTFNIKPAKGMHIVTTFAVTTGNTGISTKLTKHPVESTISDEIKIELDTDRTNISEDNAEETNPLPTESQTHDENETVIDETTEFGFGVHLLGYRNQNNTNMFHAFWAKNKFNYIERWFEMDSSLKTDQYSISVNKIYNNDHELSLDLQLFINDVEMSNIKGFRFKETDLYFAIFPWNEDDYKPVIHDIYRPFYSEVYLRKIEIPAVEDKQCMRGRAFYDRESGIKEIWIGVSDSDDIVGNIAPLSVYKSFCFQCQTQCDNVCKEQCDDEVIQDAFSNIPLEIHQLGLEASHSSESCINETHHAYCNISSYFLNAKIVNFAGLEVITHSNPIQIDITPPIFDYVQCLDPENSENEPTNFLGSRKSIGAFWNCKEDVSEIIDFTVRIDDVSVNKTIMNETNIGLKERITFTFQNNTFRNGHEYAFIVKSINTAGLISSSNCSVRVSLDPPNVINTKTNALFTSKLSNDDEEDDMPFISSSQNMIGIQWNSDNNETRLYEWQIGSKPNENDIIPMTIVGNMSVGSAAIVHGHFEFNGESTNITVSDIGAVHNNTLENNVGIKKKDDLLFLEPGRCIYQSLYAQSWSHLRSKVQGKPLCIVRPHDTKLRKTKDRRKETWKSQSSKIKVDISINEGMLTLGTLDESDKSADYGSAASIKYRPFIVDAKLTVSRTSRLLRNRVQRFCNESFYASPMPVVRYEEMTIDIDLPHYCVKDNASQPGFIFWNQDMEEWWHIDEGCSDYLKANVINNTYRATICPDKKDSTKRSTTSVISTPRAFELVNILMSVQNTKPLIITETITTDEDLVLEQFIQAKDAENDNLSFEILTNSDHAECTIEINGFLKCSFEQDYFGYDTIKIKVIEIQTNVGIEILSDVKVVDIYVKPVPDQTERIFIDNEGRIYRDTRPSMLHNSIVEANTTDAIFVGTVVLLDVDEAEVFNEVVSFSNLENSTYTLSKKTVSDITTRKFMVARFRSAIAFDINIQFSPMRNGLITLKFIAKTADNHFTPSVTLNVYVLSNPCVHGKCKHDNSNKLECDNIHRAESFTQFKCDCKPGYTDEWCQTEINECQHDSCSLLFDCEDLINAYICKINIPKVSAIVICCIVAMAGIAIILTKLRNRFRRNKVSQSSVSLVDTKVNNLAQDDESRPLSSKSILVESCNINDNPKSFKSTDIWSNPNWHKDDMGIDTSALNFLTNTAAMKLPPHHTHLRSTNLNSKSAEQNLQLKIGGKANNVPNLPPITGTKMPLNICEIKSFPQSIVFQNNDIADKASYLADIDV